jgi:NAD-dependent deacetylase
MGSGTAQIPSEAVDRMKGAEFIAVLTGAGVSAESGVPTFRGDGGLWKEYRAEYLATQEAFSENPELVWDWYHWRRKAVRKVSPNAAHRTLVFMEDRSAGFTLITQNVDGLHLGAGSKNVLEIHGNIHRARCTRCSARYRLENEEGPVMCPDCDSLMRPDIVWFGENLDPALLKSAWTASEKADFFLVAGTSGVVQPAASLAHRALRRGSYVLEVNYETTTLTGAASATVLGKAGEILPELARLAFGKP